MLELSAPTTTDSSLGFTATVVRGKDHSSQLPGMTPAPYEAPPAQLSSVSLFIDNVLPSQMWVCMDGNGRTINPPAPIPYSGNDQAGRNFEAQCYSKGGTGYIVGAE